MTPAVATWLPDNKRLHLHHGPIDLIIEAQGPDAQRAYEQAVARFDTVLIELVQELPKLRESLKAGHEFKGEIAQMMAMALRGHSGFVTPMVAVAGAVADVVLGAMTKGTDLRKAYVNNGGDIAFHLTKGQSVSALGVAGGIAISHEDPARGLATSGWEGRSHSLGIADAVTVAARTAAKADVAATLIANAVDLPGHPQISRTAANALSPDSDLGARLVTTGVGTLKPAEAGQALTSGLALATKMRDAGAIHSATLTLLGQTMVCQPNNPALTFKQDIIHYA